MKIVKRNGKTESIKFDKVLARIKKQTYGLDSKYVEPLEVAQKVISGLYDGVSSKEVDTLAAETAASMTIKHPDYSILASRIAITSLYKDTDKLFSKTIDLLYKYINPKTNEPAGMISDEVHKFIMDNAEELDSAIITDRDFLIDYFGFKTLERAYLLKIDGNVAETPQFMWMRVSAGIWCGNVEETIKTYELMSQKYFTHATPTLFNSGTKRPQLSSCFVEGTQVFTDNGPKNIENVSIGDKVITHLGNKKEVKQIHRNKLNGRKIFNIKIAGTPTIKVTGNHKFWSISKEQLKWGMKPQFNSIEYLRVGDYISIPKHNYSFIPYELDLFDYMDKSYGNVNLTYESDDKYLYPKSSWVRTNKLNENDSDIIVSRKHTPVSKKILIDEKFSFILGVWLGDGHIITGKNKEKTDKYPRGIGITVHKDNVNLISLLEKYLFDIFKIKPIVTGINNNVQQVQIHSMSVGMLFNNLFGGYFNKKNLPKLLYDWDKNMCLKLIEGIITSDGCVSKEGAISFTLSNIKLVKALFSIFRNNGIMCYYTEMNKLKTGATQKIASISFNINNIDLSNIIKIYDDNRLEKLLYKKSKENSIIEIDGNIFIRINSKNITDLTPEFVYTLGVEDDHSYVVEGVLVENCFLVGMKEDSIKGIYDTLSDIAVISQNAGGIGLHVHNVRGGGAYIKGTNGTSNGLVPMLRVFNETARYVDQGGGKRKGSFAIYLEPWHSDIYDFLDLRKNHGKEEMRTRDLFTALWVPDLFMEKVNNDEEWYLFSPDEAPGLADVVGDDFTMLYNKYVEDGKFRKVIKARDLWDKILDSQMETGTPYMLAKDAANLKSNQQNLGVIKSSNLCTEIIEYSDDKEQAVCNLASIALSMYVDSKKKEIDYQKLYDVTYQVTVNLNRVIDVNYYPTKETKKSNNRHRPIGLGVQGLADVYAKLGIPFDSEKAKEINKKIFETIYFASMTASKDLSIKEGPYETFEGSPLSKGIFQFDMWTDNTITNQKTDDGRSVTVIAEKKPIELSGMWDWESLRKDVMKHGVRNSLLFAPMPTASTSQILGNNEAFEPFTSNIYKRNTLSGEFVLVNKYLVVDLIKLGLWTDEIRNKIILAEGSVQSIDEIPQNIKDIYKTVWEIKLRDQIDMSADRGAFICQSQSFNLHVADINKAKITTALMYGWRKGLKTLSYYIRGKSITSARKDLGIDSTYKQTQTIEEQINNIACSLDNPEDCIACSA